MHFCYESEKTVNGPICSRIVALYHRNSHYEGEKSFFWSKNEIDKAKELKDRYFLYLVNRKQIGTPSYKPHIIQNPFNRVVENDLWEIEPVNWKITLL